MSFDKLWKKVVFAKWGIGVFLGVFATLWLLAEPLGIDPGVKTFIFLGVSAIILASFWLSGRKLCECLVMIDKQRQEINELRKQLEDRAERSSYCCVHQQDEPICPLGVTKIHNEALNTLQSSLLEAEHRYRWLGFTAFNVAHNNRQVFADRKHVKFEFVTLSPDAQILLEQVDKDYRSTLLAAEQASQSNSIISEIVRDVHPGVSLRHHWQMPSFRIILIDGGKALVSFYERGKDALRTHQIEIVENKDAPFCLLRWFEMFYDKVIQTEELLGRAGQQKTS